MSEWITQSKKSYAVFNLTTKLEIFPFCFCHKQCYNKHLECFLSVCIYVCKFYCFIMRTPNLVESVKYFITAKFEQRSANILYAWKGVNVLYLFVNRNTSHAIKLIMYVTRANVLIEIRERPFPTSVSYDSFPIHKNDFDL